MDDVRLVIAEEGGCTTNYLEAFDTAPELAGRVAAWGMHCYNSYPDVSGVVDHMRRGPFTNSRIWMTEYGDLDQTGEREYFFSWTIFDRLLYILEHGMQGALNWDAFDNYHDHDEYWTIYGIIRTGLRTFTRKKRYYACKQVYRFVRSGMTRVGISCSGDNVGALGFFDRTTGRYTVTGVNRGVEAVYLRLLKKNLTGEQMAARPAAFVTTDALDCAPVPCEPLRPWAGGTEGYETVIPAKSMFTITTQTPA